MYLEFGTDRDGRPWCWEYNLRRGVSTKQKEPNDIIYKKLEDLRISDTGDFVFEAESHHRRATPHEIGLLWDKKLEDRIPVQQVYTARPQHLRAGKSLKQCNQDAGRPDPAKPEREGCKTCGARLIPAGMDVMPVVSVFSVSLAPPACI